MTSESIDKKQPAKNLSTGFNRWAYFAFVLLAVYFLFRNDWMTAASNLGIALVFDPFNPTVKWQDRKLYQKAWLFVHVGLVLVLFIVGLIISN